MHTVDWPLQAPPDSLEAVQDGLAWTWPGSLPSAKHKALELLVWKMGPPLKPNQGPTPCF